jgi:RNA polymerase sigma factor (sigma-70 family)
MRSPTSNESTHCLIESARQGDTEAIQALVLRYQPDVARFARSVCATPEDAEDAVQEALWIAVQKLGTLRVAAAFTTWLFQVVKHECYRLLRRFRRETALDQVAVAQHTGDGLAEQAALAHDVAGAIAALEPHYRQVLIMRDVQAMSAPEVAATLGLTVAAVKSRLHRARVLVRTTLQGRVDHHNQPYEDMV